MLDNCSEDVLAQILIANLKCSFKDLELNSERNSLPGVWIQKFINKLLVGENHKISQIRITNLRVLFSQIDKTVDVSLLHSSYVILIGGFRLAWLEDVVYYLCKHSFFAFVSILRIVRVFREIRKDLFDSPGEDIILV